MLETRIDRLFPIVNCILITLFFYICIDMFYSVLVHTYSPLQPTDKTLNNSHIPKRNFASLKKKTFSNYAVITSRNLFNQKKEEKAPSKVKLSNLEQTTLSLKLWGTMVSDPGTSYAVIENTEDRSQRGKGRLIKEGGMISDATLSKVFRDKVVLNVNGSSEILSLEDYGNRRSRRSRSRYSSRSSRSQTPVRQKKKISRQVINKALDNMNDLLKQARVRPHYKNGSPDGFIISRIKRNSLFRKLGLRNGDIISEVNGEQINSMDQAMAMYQGLVSSDSIEIKLKRRGRGRIINYNIH